MSSRGNLRTTLTEAISRKRFETSSRDIALEARLDAGNLSKFINGVRGLRATRLESLCNTLGVGFLPPGTSFVDRKPMLAALRQARKSHKGSLRAIARHTGIDVGNLSRFFRGERNGLSFSNLELLLRFLKVEIAWTGRLVVLVQRWHGVGRATPLVNITVECIEHPHDYGWNERHLGVIRTDQNGRAEFGEVGIRSRVDVFVSDILRDTIEITDSSQEFAVEL